MRMKRTKYSRGSSRLDRVQWLLVPVLLLLMVIGINDVRAFSTGRSRPTNGLLSLEMGRALHFSPPIHLGPLNKYFLQPLLSNIWRSDASSFYGEDYDFSNEKNTSKLILHAESLRAQAKSIRAQALAMEQDLKKTRSIVRNSKARESDAFIEQWFRVPTNDQGDFQEKNTNEEASSTTIASATMVADRLENENITQEQILLVIDRIFERRMEASGQTSFLESDGRMVPDLGEDSEKGLATSYNESEVDRLDAILESFLSAIKLVDERVNNKTLSSNNLSMRWSGRVDSEVQARLNELRQTQKIQLDRKLAAEINNVAKSATGAVEEYVRRKIDGEVLDETGATTNSTSAKVQEKMALAPLWVPSVFLPFIIASTSTKFGPGQVQALNDQVLVGSRFYVTSQKSIPGAAIFRGNIRGFPKASSRNTQQYRQCTADAFEDIQKRLQKVPDLRDRVQLFLLPDPEWRPKNDDQEQEPKPVVLALSIDISPDESKIRKGTFVETGKKMLFPLALFSTIRYSIEGFSLNQIFFDALVKQQNSRLLLTMCFPVVGGILAMHLLQEVVHYSVAKWRRIKIGSPVPIPSFELGLFGCITPIKSFPSDRAALLDFALCGPFAMIVASVGCIIASILLTVRASPAALANFPVLPTLILKSSFLAGTLTSWIASKVMMLPLAQPVPVHPLFLVGYSGLIASGLNLLPIFRLDGGRACSAAMGSRQAAVISVSMLLFLLSLTLSGGTGIGFSWGMIVALFQRQQEIPARDDVTEVDNVRLGAWLFSFLLAIGILTPFPGAPSIL